MDVCLLKRYDLAQDVDSLYKEILRNCKNKGWYCSAGSNDGWQCIDRLYIRYKKDMLGHYRICITNDDKWILEKWINLT